MILFLYCLVTIAIELPFLALFGYRSGRELLIIACANAVTNLSMNLILVFAGNSLPLIAVLELAAVAAEYLIYAAVFGRSKRLFLLTLAANALSFGLGLLIFGI